MSSFKSCQPVLEFRLGFLIERGDHLDTYVLVLGYLFDDLPGVQVETKFSRDSFGDGLAPTALLTTDRNDSGADPIWWTPDMRSCA